MLEKLKLLTKQTDAMAAIGIVGILMMMVLPIPPIMMDLFLAISITLALVVLLTTMYLTRPLQFSVFPSILLVMTLYRLSLNIATTRLILINGHTGPKAAGSVIMSFGQFVVGGNYVVGIIVFLILVIINFIVITKGAGRIAEVAARFVLDSMPGKQMSIDADLNAGILGHAEAKKRRREVEQEADFYGAMDGASKFVRGDAIAGLLITAINIVAGFIIGVAQNGLPLADAAATYTILTVGDGLVSQIPALITSTAAGILVTRTATDKNMGDDFAQQIFSNWKVLSMVGAFLLLFSIVPGMPTVIFVILAIVLFFAAFRAKKQESVEVVEGAEITEEEVEPEMSEGERLESLLPLDLLDLEVGYGLINMVDSRQGGELLERITALRRQFVTSYGIIVPPIHIRDNLQVEPTSYKVLLKGTELASGEVIPDKLLAMNPGDVTEDIEGIDTVEPAFGLPAKWIGVEMKERAEALGFTVVDASTVAATHLSEVLKNHAADLIGRQELQQLLDVFSRTNQKLVEELIPNILSLGEILKVCKSLLKEQISIRDLRTILETLADMGSQTKNPEVLTEIVRQRLGKSITNRFKAPDNNIYAIMMDQSLEDLFRNSQRIMDDEIQVAIDPEHAKVFLNELENQISQNSMHPAPPVLLVSPEIRKGIYNLISRFLPDLPVISHREVDQNVNIQLVGTVNA